MIRFDGPAARALRALVCKVLPDMEDICETWQDWVTQVPSCGESVVRILTNDYRQERRVIRQAYLRWIRQAKREIVLANSYFIPDRLVRRALVAAVRRGVQVRVLLPGLSGVPAVRYASRRLYHRLLAQGIRIFEWNGAMLHAKTMVVDGNWALVGSSNLNPFSLLGNFELDVEIQDAELAGRLEAQFLTDLERAREITLHDWLRRPRGQRWGERFGALLLWLPYKLFDG
jgi:cardiolipin synthase A/B